MYNAGVSSIKEEKLVASVVSVEDRGASTEELGSATFLKYTMNLQKLIEVLQLNLPGFVHQPQPVGHA